MLVLNGNDIKVPYNNNFEIQFKFYDEDEEYVVQNGDVFTFTIRKNFKTPNYSESRNPVLFQRQLADGVLRVNTGDLELLYPQNYVYDVELLNKNDMVLATAIIGKFTVSEVVT